MCPGKDLNLHGLPRLLLRQVRLPISPPGHIIYFLKNSSLLTRNQTESKAVCFLFTRHVRLPISHLGVRISPYRSCVSCRHELLSKIFTSFNFPKHSRPRLAGSSHRESDSHRSASDHIQKQHIRVGFCLWSAHQGLNLGPSR